MTNSIYSSVTETKTNSIIPLLQNHHTIESKYNPEREAENIINQLEKNYSFFILGGIASGILIKMITEKFPSAKIIGIETNSSDIEFLKQIQTVDELSKNENIIFTDIEHIQNSIIKNYIPSKYGDAKIIFQRNWAIELSENFEHLKTSIMNAINIVSADYSVQSHFGKIWQSNIIKNIKLLSQIKTDKLKIDNNKTALVIAAGPSLDNTISKIEADPDKYFIISTDTAFQTLIKRNIEADVVLSIDGQYLSYNHFFSKNKNIKTHFIFDLCGNPAITRKLTSQNKTVHFFSNGHPLSEAFSAYSGGLLNLYTGTGTVTIAAIDFALKSGFKNIELIGADFGYLNGKSYSKGTYLDSLYYKRASRINTAEKTYDKLMFRTELKKISAKKVTTEILNSYKNSLEDYLTSVNTSFVNKDDTYFINAQNNNSKLSEIKNSVFNIIDFFKFIDQNKEIQQNAMLPYLAYLRTKSPDSNLSYEELHNLAYTDFLSYNKYYEK